MGELVYIGSCAGTFYAFERHTGAVLWSYDVTGDGNGQFHSDPVLVGDTIVVGSDSGSSETSHVYAFDATTGVVRWMHPVDQGVFTDLLAIDDRVIAVTKHEEMVALDVATGVPQWTIPGTPLASDLFNSSPASDGDVVWFATQTGTMLRLDVRSGELLGEGELPAAPTTSVLRTERGLLVGTEQPGLFQLDPVTLESTDELPLGGRPIAHLRLVGGLVLVLADEARTLLAVDPKSLTVRWSRPADGAAEWSSYRPHAYRDWVLVGDSNGDLVAFRLEDGGEAWRWSFGNAVRGIGTADDQIFVGTIKGTITAFALP